MRKGTMIAGGVAALLAATAVGAALVAGSDEDGLRLAGAPKEDCRVVATRETGFDPATTPVPLREDAGNKQVLKGTGAGAAVGALAGEIIGGKPGMGAAAGAAAGAAGGHAIKTDKQNDADARYEANLAAYSQQKAAYDAALTTCLG